MDDDAARAPRLARAVATLCAPQALREFLLGDLDEQFGAVVRQRGRPAARRWYWTQTWGLVRSAWGLRRRARRGKSTGTTRRSIDMSTWWREGRLALRSLAKAPGYSAMTMITLALAIGANTLLFSIVNPIAVRALPMTDPDGLGWILLRSPEREIERARASLPELLEWRDTLRSFSALAALEYGGGTLTGHGDARRVQIARVTTNLPAVWGLQPHTGRLFQPGEDAPGPLAAVVSFRFWREAFQQDPAIVGRTFALDGRTLAIAGVMTPDIELGNLSLVDLWVPLALEAAGAARDRRTLTVVGRLAPGATLASADAELQTVFARQAREHPAQYRGWQASVVSTTEAVSAPDTWIILGLLAIVVLFVLLIACANLANLVLARLVARRQEAAVRIALGASRWRLVRPLMVESLLLGAAGGAVGLALAYGGLRIVNAVASEPFMRQLGIDGNVLAFTAALSILTPLVFSVWPAVIASRSVAADALHGTRTSGGRGASRRRHVLIGVQVALALSLLVLSALMTQSMRFLQRIDPGFDAGMLLTYRFDLPEARYADDGRRLDFLRRLDARLGALPGIEAAAIVSHLPVIDADQPRVLTGTRHDGATEADRPWASWFAVTAGFFDASGIEIIAGRPFGTGDRDDTEPVAILSRMAAARYFGTPEDAVGRRIVIHDARRGEQPATVVGVAADTRDAQLTRTSPQVFVPLSQWPAASLRAIVRAPDPLRAAPDVRTVMRDLDPEIAVADLKPVSFVLEEELSSSRIIEGMLIGYALLALALAAGGLFGVISYSVGQRRREIGVRLALGASPRGIARMIVREGLVVTGIGAAAGLLIASALAQYSTAVLYGVSPRDPATFGGVLVVILVVAVAASWLPAAQAMRVEPATTLRE